MTRPYTRHATPEDAAAARRASVRKSNEKNKEKYAEKRKAYSKARYAANRERLIEEAKARYAANPEAQKERNRRRYPAVRALVDGRIKDIKETFELLPEERREEYAEWLLFLAGADSYTGQAVRHPSLDYNYIAVYADV